MEEIIRRDDFLGGRVFDCSSSKSRGEEEVEEGGVSASILAPLPRFRRGSIKSFDTVGNVLNDSWKSRFDYGRKFELCEEATCGAFTIVNRGDALVCFRFRTRSRLFKG